MSSIYIVEEGGDFLDETYTMFERNGWTPTLYMDECDFLCLLGGIDVSPSLYGEEACPETYSDIELDRIHLAYIEEWEKKCHKQNKPPNKIGICRGSQLLNVHFGGKMWQDIDGHSMKHSVEIKGYGATVVSSIHHQQMIPGPDAEIIGMSYVSTVKVKQGSKIHAKNMRLLEDPEILWYPKHHALLFQPHPELDENTEELFFDLVEQYFNLNSRELY